ncbi:MAG: nodulation protein NodJ [Piscirickettsiaceae bacterium]|nr:MAG: nodulation protein NodJ [Piscirickettsiaceae bacterium]PCI68780.1 MAG: nodulation protein NodJ [Piscirickettsiaceae bacterium]
MNKCSKLLLFFRRSVSIWSRNIRVWSKLAGPSLMGNFGEPLLYLLVLGYGLGQFVGEVQGLTYMAFLASGVICTSAVNSASFEGMYSAYTRMDVQQTWLGMLSTPVGVGEVVFGEILWAATKSLISVIAILIVATGLGLVADAWAILILPVAFLTGLCFASLALLVTSSAKSYDFFLYYTTLFITPMVLLSGVFFPIDTLPMAVQWLAKSLPLYHAISLVRPLMTGGEVSSVLMHLSVLTVFGALAGTLATYRIKKRLIK